MARIKTCPGRQQCRCIALEVFNPSAKVLNVLDADKIFLAEIEDLAAEITRYLQEHDGAADTLAGVTQWWILRQRLQEERQKVQEAMDYLCAKGVVKAQALPDGEILYSATQGNKNTRSIN